MTTTRSTRNKMTNSFSKLTKPKAAKETVDADGLGEAMTDVQNAETCNVCDKAWRSLCRLIYYCQRKDGDGHEKVCKGKQEKKQSPSGKSDEPEMVTNTNIEKKQLPSTKEDNLVRESSEPSSDPSAAPSLDSSAAPSSEPSLDPSAAPSLDPSAAPSPEPSLDQSAGPSSESSSEPPEAPSAEPLRFPELLPRGVWVVVLGFCSVGDYRALIRTPDALIRTPDSLSALLTRDEIVDPTIRAANERIVENWRALQGDTIDGRDPTTFQELEFWEIASEFMRRNRMYPQSGALNDMRQFGVHNAVREILSRLPDLVVILDAHWALNAPPVVSETQSVMLANYVGMFFFETIQRNLQTTIQIRIRPWGRSAVESAMAIQDAHGVRVANGRGWVDVSLRMNDGLEFPPRSLLYANLDTPRERAFPNPRDMAFGP